MSTAMNSDAAYLVTASDGTFVAALGYYDASVAVGAPIISTSSPGPVSTSNYHSSSCSANIGSGTAHVLTWPDGKVYGLDSASGYTLSTNCSSADPVACSQTTSVANTAADTVAEAGGSPANGANSSRLNIMWANFGQDPNSSSYLALADSMVEVLGNGTNACSIRLSIPNFGPAAQSNLQEFTDVVAHEMGHCMGLDHSSDINSVMWPTNLQGDTFSSDDEAVLAALRAGANIPVGECSGTQSPSACTASQTYDSQSKTCVAKYTCTCDNAKGWAVAGGSQLPPGMSLTQGPLPGGALLSGTPTSAGNFVFDLQVTDGANSIATAQFSLTISGGFMTLSGNGIVNAASYASGRVSPGEIVTLFGSFPGPATMVGLQLNSEGNVSTELGGIEVLFDGIQAPLIYAEAGQVGCVVPYEVAGKNLTQVQVSYQGQLSNAVAEPVAAVVPGVFTANSSGSGQGAIVNQDGTANTASNPAALGSVVSAYATGEGQTNPAGVDGRVDTAPLPQPLAQPVTATVGGVAATVQYAGGASGLIAGLLQVNIQIPQGISPGSAVPIVLTVGGISSQANVTIALH